MARVYGRNGASFCVIFAPNERFTNQQYQQWLRTWYIQSVWTRQIGYSSGYYFRAKGRQFYDWISRGASNDMPDRELIPLWQQYTANYAETYRQRVYGPGGIIIGSQSYGGAGEQVDYARWRYGSEVYRRGLWPYLPPLGVLDDGLPGDPRNSVIDRGL